MLSAKAVNADMNIVDVSSHQGNYQVGSYNEDGAIVKATQGVGYLNPYLGNVANQVLQQNKVLGFYHYASGNDPVTEARYFVESVQGYLGNSNKPTLWLDWEEYQNGAWGNGLWAKQFTDEVKRLTGVQPGIYTGLDGVKQTQQYLADTTALWFAGYPYPIETGWNPTSFGYDVGNWKVLTGWQFSSTPLDKSKFYTDKAGWAKIAGQPTNVSVTPEPAQPQQTGGTLEQIATQVQQGLYGDGETRKANLGEYYNAVQIIINERCGLIDGDTAHNMLADEIIQHGNLGTGSDRTQLLGTYADSVQSIINSIL